jgi:hypothetical protein
MASEIRVNQIQNRSGLSTVTFSDTGVVLSGVSTFTVSSGSASVPSISPSGDSNTGIFFPSPDTIAFAEGGVEGFRLDSSANIGIGTNNPNRIGVNSNSKCLSIFGDGLITNARGTLELGNPIADATGNTLGSIYFVSGIGATNYAEIRAVSSGTGGANGFGNELRFATKNDNGTTSNKLSLLSNGNLLVGSGNVTLSNGNLVFSTAGTGIDFSATANSSGTMTSELLADYEEGIFSPTAFGSSSAGTTTYGLQFGMYVKIGNLCHFQVRMQVTNMTGTGDLYLGGLPFNTISDTERAYASIAVGYLDNLSFGNVSDTHLVLYTQQNNNYVVVRSSGNNRASTAVPVDSSFTILYGGTYRTA